MAVVQVEYGNKVGDGGYKVAGLKGSARVANGAPSPK